MVGIVLIVVVLGIVTVWTMSAHKTASQDKIIDSGAQTSLDIEHPNATVKTVPTNTLTVPAELVAEDGKKKIYHPTFGFTITVPNTVEWERYEEGGGSETLVFVDTVSQNEFQLFVTPYTDTEITPERLAADIPSGDIREPTEIVLDNGVSAMMFWSQAPIVGESREVWFIHDGYLYEATTARALDPWLAFILNTIVFD